MIVKRNTDIVIEGFPRSGNTFFSVFFSESVKGKIQIAHHTHAPVQFRLASRFKVPSIVLLRNPIDSIKSLKIMYPQLTITSIARGYVEFYNYILKKALNVKILPFEVLINDFENVAVQLIKEFNFEYNESCGKIDTEKIFSKIRNIKGLTGSKFSTQVSIPDKVREERKKRISVDTNSKYVNRSMIIYNQLLSKSDFTMEPD